MPSTRAAPILERETELSRLRELAHRAGRGEGAVVLLEGPAGIGKTALLRAAREEAAAEGLRVLSATASELDRAFAFGLTHQLLDPVLEAATAERRAELLAGAAAGARSVLEPGAHEPAASHAALHGLYWLLVNLADDGPIALCVDDLHWADSASLRFLEFCGRRLEDVGALVVGTLRPAEPGADAALLTALAAGPSVEVLRPGALSTAGAGALVADALGVEADETFAEACHAATGGNPLLLHELGRAAAEQGLQGAAEEAPRVAVLGSAGLSAAVGRRLRALGEDAVAVARAAAVLGPQATLDDLAAVAGIAPDATTAAADALVGVGLLDADERSFVHPLVGAAVAAAIPPGRLAQLHGIASRRLIARDARADRIATHLLRAEPAGDPEVVACLRAAAAIAAGEGEAETAIAHLRRALAEPPPPQQRAEVALALGQLEALANIPGGLEHLDEALAAGLEPQDQARALVARARLLIGGPAPADALSDLERAITLTTDERLRLRVAGTLFDATAYVTALDGRRRELLDAARRSAEPSCVELAHLAQDAAYTPRPAAETERLARAALRGGELLRIVGADSGTYNLLALALRHAELPDLALAMLDEGEADLRRLGARPGAITVDHARAYWHLMYGSLVAGEGHARSALEVASELGYVTWDSAMRALLCELLLERDELDEAEVVIGEVELTPLNSGQVATADILCARGAVHWARGRRDEAEADFRTAAAALRERGWGLLLKGRPTLRLALLLAERGALDEARAIAEADVAVAREAGLQGTAGAALRGLGRATPDAEGLALLEESVTQLAGSRLTLEHGWALHDLGAMLRRGGRRVDAREPLRAALDVASRCGAALLARQVRDELLATGSRPRRAALQGPESLTPSERRVAELAAEGLSNREIAETLWVTRKTVELHLGRCYAKLQIRSREQLPDALGR